MHDTWLSDAEDRLKQITLGPAAYQMGRVEEIGDGVAMISGLGNVRLDELLRFDGGQFGFAQVLDDDLINLELSTVVGLELHHGVPDAQLCARHEISIKHRAIVEQHPVSTAQVAKPDAALIDPTLAMNTADPTIFG